MRQVRPYGSWASPITTEVITARSARMGDLRVDGASLFWEEGRPWEAGRMVVVRDGADVTPPGYNARTRVHEYGGAAFAAAGDQVWFANFDDQRLYRQVAGAPPEPITAALDRRYADIEVDRRRQMLFAVREDHTAAGEAVNALVRLGWDGEGEEVVAEGADFYSDPRLTPDASRLCWLQWSHPHMPWDGTQLWVADVDEAGGLGAPRRVPGAADDAIFAPRWSPSGVLHFVSDRTGWWNLYRWVEEGAEPRVENLLPMEAEFGLPQWVFGLSTYAFTAAADVVCTWTGPGGSGLGVLGKDGLRRLDSAYGSFAYVGVAGDDVVFIGSAPDRPSAVVRLDLQGGRERVVKEAMEIPLDSAYISKPQPIEFPTTGGKTAHGYFYPPANPVFEAPPGELPPLVVHSHGGPTSAYGTALNLANQYLTSRGIAVVEVNYGGSTGYGTEYRRRLNGQWGVVDVDDCCNAARYLVGQGVADGARLAVAGGSAGGYTTLASLTMRPEVFGAGVNSFGLSDLRVFVHDTHKFESRYLDSLVGPFPEAEAVYQERSPLSHLDALRAPLLTLQGDEDKIVPPSQSEIIVEAARRKGLPVAYLLFEGEQHGFRKAHHIRRALEAELYFYGAVFDFATADDIEPVPIENF